MIADGRPERTVEVLARIAVAYELGQSLDGTLLTITFEHEDGESVIGIPAEALSGFIERLEEADEALARRRARLQNVSVVPDA